jgi:hypoxanthine-DNA glycosylase
MNEKGFGYVISEQAKILILGTAPGRQSLKEGKYYQNSNNKIWEALSSVVNGITKDNYESKLEDAPVGLWDVFSIVEGTSSKDDERKLSGVNEFKFILNNYPIKYVILNGNGKDKEGKQALREFLQSCEQMLDERGIKLFVLTSTSGSNRLKPKEKLRLWKDLLSLLILQ